MADPSLLKPQTTGRVVGSSAESRTGSLEILGKAVILGEYVLDWYSFASLLIRRPLSERSGIERFGRGDSNWPGVTPPRLLHKVEPEYSPGARADHIQGTVVLELAIDEQGRPTGITVIRPLGFGLDERAQSAVETWRFAPGMKDGKPVKILATVEVNFRFPEIWFYENAERERTSFNVALQTIKRSDSSDKALDRAVKSIQDLSRQKFPPAMYLVGIWETAGEHVTQDAADGLPLIQKAATKNYGPAMYETANPPNRRP